MQIIMCPVYAIYVLAKELPIYTGINSWSAQQMLSQTLKILSGHFTFLDESGTILTGEDAVLRVAATRCWPNFVPPSIIGVVGKKCATSAKVTHETSDADPSIVFLTISKSQLISTSTPPESSSSHSDSATKTS
jgi:hypothetical protein